MVRTIGSRCLRVLVLGLCMKDNLGVTQSRDGVPGALGEFPLCEGSAALWLGGEQLLVGDNEVRDAVFGFPLIDEELGRTGIREYGLGPGVEISDVEALAGLRSGEVFVLGSHSRNTRCRARGNRRRFLRGRVTADSFVGARGGVVEMDGRVSCASLFGDIDDGDALLAAVCQKIDEVEEVADRIWESDEAEGAKVEACDEAGAFNAEGAVAVGDGVAEAVWVGLRSPLLHALVDGRGELAILLRMRSLERYAFDAAALVDLGGAGIRELTVSDGWVFAIAGPEGDDGVDSGLWMFSIEELEASATISPRFVGSLPRSAEGLAVVGSVAHVIMDGDQGDDRCVEPARYLRLPLGGA